MYRGPFVAEPREYPKVHNYQETFRKTLEEKYLLIERKAENKAARRQVYGINYKKFLNVPSGSLQFIEETV